MSNNTPSAVTSSSSPSPSDAPVGAARRPSICVGIVFLLDATGSMGPCINAVRNNIEHFAQTLSATDIQTGAIIKDWRTKIVGHRDYIFGTFYGRPAFINNPFVRTAEELDAQLAALKPEGGGDGRNSTFDALYDVATMGATGRGEKPDPTKWRYRGEASRNVFLFTDAPPYKTMDGPGREGKTVNDLVNILHSERIILTVFAPDVPPNDGWGSYYELTKADKAQYQIIETAADDASSRQRAFADLFLDTKTVREIMGALAETCSAAPTLDDL
jgi:hypothetical protein